MQIVINIPEDDYKEVLKDAYSGTPFENRVFSAIQNGTVLPKGHGRCIDADELYLSIQTDEQQRLGEHLSYVYDEIQSAYTVIEAEMESEE